MVRTVALRGWLVPLVGVLGATAQAIHGYAGYAVLGGQPLGMTLHGQQIGFFGIFVRSLPSWLLFAVLAYPAVHAAWRRPLGHRPGRSDIAYHLAGGALFASVFIVGAALMRHVLFLRDEIGASYSTVLTQYYITYFNVFFLLYWGVVGVASALNYQQKLREHEIGEARLREQLARVRLSHLELQLRPHFLFNTLNAIASGSEDRQVANALGELADFLRGVLRDDRTLVPLADEIEMARVYLRLHELRFEQQPTFEVTMSNRAAAALLPPLILQPLIENAVVHGPSGAAGAVVALDAAQHGGNLMIQIRNPVADAAPGRESAATRGIGLANVKERLDVLYGNEAELTFEVCDGVACVVLRIPVGVADIPRPDVADGFDDEVSGPPSAATAR